MAGSVLKSAKKRAGELSTMTGKTVLPTFTTRTEAQEEADRLNIINQLVIGAKEGVVKALSKLVRINESPASAPPSINQATSARKQTPSLILRHAPTAPMAVSATPPTIKDSLSEVLASRSIINRQRKLLIEIDDDGHKKMFHVEDFVGLYPSWPIIELASLQ
jgi:hypothetical protein